MQANITSRHLNLNDAIKIWRRRSAGAARSEIAAAYDVNQEHISELLSRSRFPAAKRSARTWRGVGAARG